MKSLILSIIYICTLAFPTLHAAVLEQKEVKPLFSYMLKMHIKYDEFSEELLQRALLSYYEQFDRNREYFLKSEISSIQGLNRSSLSELLQQVNDENYNAFVQLHDQVERVIHRARKHRAESKRKLLLREFDIVALPDSSPHDYFYSEADLQERADQSIDYLIKIYENEHALTTDLEKRAAIIDWYERNMRDQEEVFLDQKQFPTLMMKAMSSSLDAHTGFYSEGEVIGMRYSLSNEMVGIGIEMQDSVDGVVVKSVLANTPAENKLMPGDLLTQIDGNTLNNVRFKQVLEMLSGAKGTSITLVVQRKEESVELKLTRTKIVLEMSRLSFKKTPFGSKYIGVITIPSFYDNQKNISVSEDFRAALKKLNEDKDLEGLVIDIRDNGGGYLQQAVSISSQLIPEGVVLVAKYARGKLEYIKKYEPKLPYDFPVVFLTNKRSASAAEIVAQAVRDYGRAVIAGDTSTFGKGTFQTQTITSTNAAHLFKVTTGAYYSPSGESTQFHGVKSDCFVPTIWEIFRIGEKYLKYALPPESLFQEHIVRKMQPELKNYLLEFKRREATASIRMLPRLSANSVSRIESDSEYKHFIRNLHKARTSKESFDQLKSMQFSEDLQMSEALNIVRDMIMISRD